jgi:3-hydroxybutyryl-CoA dehydrogenase
MINKRLKHDKMPERLSDYSLNKKIIQGRNGGLQKVGVIGAGSMGQEIIRIIARHGIEVVFIDKTEELLVQIRESLEKQLDEIINKWGITPSEKRAIMSRIEGSIDFNDVRDCDLIIETIHRKGRGTSLQDRKEIFRNVEGIIDTKTVIASNNATLMISDLASALNHPERTVGFNFITPVSKVGIVEVIRGLDTNDESYDFALRFIRMLDKRPITLNESLGNISTRLIVTLINEACEVLMEGVAPVNSIDDTMKLGYGLQLGPFELADRVGLDKVQKWMDNLYFEYGEQKFKPSPILKRLVRANHLGRKTGKGFYKYEHNKIVSQAITITDYI